MKSRWTFRYKTPELGKLKLVSHRLRFVAKGYYQAQGLHYFENYAPVASFIMLRSSHSQVFQTFMYYKTMYLLPSFKANSTQTIYQFTVNVPKDTKIDANTVIVFIAICTA